MAEPSREPCPNGGVHDYQYLVRDRQDHPGQKQDAIACSKCEAILYPWRTIRTKEKTA